MYSTNFEEWLTQTFLPCGVVYSTESAKKILSKNNLTASEFLRPFGDFNGKKITIPFGEKINYQMQSFRIDFYDNDNFFYKNNSIEKIIITLLLDEKVRPKWSVGDSFSTKNHCQSLILQIKNYSFPWGFKFEKTFIECLNFNEYELFQQPFIKVYLCSIKDSIEEIEKLKSKDKIPRLIREGVYENPRPTLLLTLNDKSDKDNFLEQDEKVKKFQELSEYFNKMMYYTILVDINGDIEGKNINISEYWSQYFHFTDLYNPEIISKNRTIIGRYILNEEIAKLKEEFYSFFVNFALKRITEYVVEIDNFIIKNKKAKFPFFNSSSGTDEFVNYYNIPKLAAVEKKKYVLGIYHFYFRNYKSAGEIFKSLSSQFKEQSKKHYLAFYQLHSICTFINGTYKKESDLDNCYMRYLEKGNSHTSIRAFIIFLKMKENLRRFGGLFTKINNFIKLFKKNFFIQNNPQNNHYFLKHNQIFQFYKPMLFEKKAIYYLVEFNKYRKFLVELLNAGRYYFKSQPEMDFYSIHCFGFLINFLKTNPEFYTESKEYVNHKMGTLCKNINYHEGGFIFFKNLLNMGKYIQNIKPDEQDDILKNYLINLKEITQSQNTFTSLKLSEINSLSIPEIDNTSLLIVEERDFVIAQTLKNQINTVNQLMTRRIDNTWECFSKYKAINSHQLYCHLDEKDIFLLQNLDNISFGRDNYSNFNTKRIFSGYKNSLLYVSFVLSNTLNIDFPISSIQLFCEFTPAEEEEGSNMVNDPSEYLEYSRLSFVLSPNASERILLWVKCKKSGKCVVKGVEFVPNEIGLIKHYFNSKKRNKLYSHRHRTVSMNNERKGSCSSQSSQSSGSTYNKGLPNHYQNQSLSLTRKSDIIFNVIDEDKDIIITFPCGREIILYQYELFMMPIEIELKSKISKIKKVTIFVDDSHKGSENRKILLFDYYTKDNCFTEECKRITVYVPILPMDHIGKEKIKILVKFEEESKMKYVEIRRFIVQIMVKESLVITHHENIEQFVFCDNCDDLTKTKIKFQIKSTFHINNLDHLNNLRIDKVNVTKDLRITNNSSQQLKCIQQNIENNEKTEYDKFYLTYLIESKKSNFIKNPKHKITNIIKTKIKKTQEIEEKQNNKYDFSFLPEYIIKDQEHIINALTKLLSKTNVILYAWKAHDKIRNKEIIGIFYHEIRLAYSLNFQILRNLLRNSLKIGVSQIKLSTETTLVNLNFCLEKKSFTEINEISWYEIVITETDENRVKWFGTKNYKVNNKISPNLEENSINLNFSFLSIVKGYFEINNICILFYTKEPTSIIEVKNVANSFAIDIE